MWAWGCFVFAPHDWVQNGISRFGPTTRIWHCCYNNIAAISKNNKKNLILISWSLANGCFCSGDFAAWEAPASLQLCIEFIACLELKQSYCENLESIPAVFAKLSWNFHLSLSGCSAFAGNRQYIAGLSIHSRDMTCFDGLYLKKSRPACSILGQNIDISFGPNGAPLGARWWSTLRTASRSY